MDFHLNCSIRSGVVDELVVAGVVVKLNISRGSVVDDRVVRCAPVVRQFLSHVVFERGRLVFL